MAISRQENQITWSAASSVSVTSGSTQTSDTITIDDTAVDATVVFKVDNSTAAAADDIIYFWLQESNGDPDGAGADEFTTNGHSRLLWIGNTSTEDPAISPAITINSNNKSCRIRAEGATAGTTNAITVSGTIYERIVS